MTFLRSLLAAGLAVLLGLSLVPNAQADRADRADRAAQVDHAPVPGPIHAGNTWGWYQFGVTRHEFVGPKPKYWVAGGPGVVQNQHGMLTLNTSTRGTVTATLARPGRAYGRWEIRMRSRRYGTKAANFRVITELIPAGKRNKHCGGQNIALENYVLGSNRVKHYIHTLPNNTFRKHLGRNLGADRWHTYAVEVTPHRISWFVDAHIISSETRKEALAPVPRTLRFTMQAQQGRRMNKSRMQMDWMRYWSLKAPNERSTKAPKTELSTYAGAC